jgi:hypothetical protein
MLVVATAAYASLNSYTASMTFSGKAGSARRPAPIGFVQQLGASPSPPAVRAAPLIDIKTTIYGLTANGGAFPTCNQSKILTPPKYNGNCPGGSLVASGRVSSQLGSPDLSKAGVPCNPYLSVYNAGKGRLWFFFTTKTPTDCAGLTTGATPPYPGFARQSGKNLVVDVPLPPFVSTKVANQTGVYGSLIGETLNWKKLTTRYRGKSVAYQASVGCKAGKRPWTIAYTATNGAGTKETKTVAGSSKC